MKISEVQHILSELKINEGDIKVLGISINENHITVCYEDSDFNTRCKKVNYKSCDEPIQLNNIRNSDKLNITFTYEELLALPIIIKMAETYNWELPDKTPDKKYWERHKYLMTLIEEYHNNRQGIMANGQEVSRKIKELLGRIIE
ncbi:MAG TPA: hypothetical protein GX708_24715 [Gallicola sp.]|nr:hypothetical protein [Gallicola sp.]